MRRRLTALSVIIAATVLSALLLRNILLSNELNGTHLLSLKIISFDLNYLINTGVNFGIAADASSNRQIILALLAGAVSAGIIIYGVRTNRSWILVASALFAGGGLANAFERVAFGGVFDYINLTYPLFANSFSFNLADIYIFVGAVMFIFKPSRVRSS